MLVWEDAYKIGHEEMDSQHLVLLALLNQLDINIDSSDDPAAGPCLTEVMGALSAYIDYHFAAEEAVMRAASYPRLDDHLAAHHGFIAELARLRGLADSGTPLQAALKVRSLVVNWLLGHILETDVDYARHIASAAR